MIAKCTIICACLKLAKKRTIPSIVSEQSLLEKVLLQVFGKEHFNENLSLHSDPFDTHSFRCNGSSLAKLDLGVKEIHD